MAEAGVSRFVEFGGKVVAPMIKRSAGDVDVFSVVTMEDIETLIKDL
jgi:[acyl-carrier-protein] S-malonyltransferase